LPDSWTARRIQKPRPTAERGTLAVSRTVNDRFHWLPILGGIIDPFTGVFTSLLRLFWPFRLSTCADSPRRRRRGMTLIVGGIEGPSSYSLAMAVGLLRSRYRGSVIRFAWNRGIPLLHVFRNLMNRRHHETQSDSLAAKIVRQKMRFPDAPICLLAQSGGCWIVVRALEKLPPGCKVQTAVLLAPAISPDHDLTVAA
jgi:hypothetical protein